MTDNFDGEQSGAVLDERFELLSAYLDGEATDREQQQIEAWLTSDPAFKQLYRQMQQMHQAFASIPVPSSQSATALTTEVFAKIDARRQRKLSWIGGGAIAATLLATIASLGGLFGDRGPQFQFAANSKANTPAPLMVALNDPILSIPAKVEPGIEVPMTTPEVNVD